MIDKPSENALHDEDGLPGPRSAADERHKARPDFNPSEFAGSDRVKRRRLAAGRDLVAPVVEQVGGRSRKPRGSSFAPSPLNVLDPALDLSFYFRWWKPPSERIR